MLGRFVDRVALFPQRRVVHGDPGAGDGFQDHEVAHVPVHDRRQAELPEIAQFESQRSPSQVQMVRDLDESAQRDALQ
jgi:hypothetical protein